MEKYLVVFDIDGTLADPGHRLHHILGRPKDWDAFFAACLDDEPIPQGLSAARAFHSWGVDMEFWTGRPERVRGPTRTWLAHHLGPWTADVPLKMRGDDDRRPDVKVKPEYIDGREPHIIFEDRASVVEEFRRRGLTVYHVAKGDF